MRFPPEADEVVSVIDTTGLTCGKKSSDVLLGFFFSQIFGFFIIGAGVILEPNTSGPNTWIYLLGTLSVLLGWGGCLVSWKFYRRVTFSASGICVEGETFDWSDVEVDTDPLFSQGFPESSIFSTGGVALIIRGKRIIVATNYVRGGKVHIDCSGRVKYLESALKKKVEQMKIASIDGL